MCPTDGRRALVLGWTGGIGMTIVRALAQSRVFTQVTLIGRKTEELPPSSDEFNYDKFTQRIVDFSKLGDQDVPEFQDLEDTTAFYAIGVHTPSFFKNQEFYEVEYVNAMKLGKQLRTGGCAQVHWILGQGTGRNSIFYFGRVKAQVQEEIGALGFPQVNFYHPGTVCTSDGRGLCPQYLIWAANWLDRGRWWSLDGDGMGRFIVNKATLLKMKNEGNNPGRGGSCIEIFYHSDMV